MKGGRRLLCANLADLAFAGAARGRGPATAGAAGMSAGHGPLRVVRDCGVTPAATPGLSAGHGRLRVARGRGLAVVAASGLSAGHGPLRAARGCGATPGLLAGHTPSFLEMHLRGECISAHT